MTESLRHRHSWLPHVAVEFVAFQSVCHQGVEIDDPLTGRAPSLDWWDIDRRDALGRTALMRAASRGHDHLVEELLEAGADPTAVDRRGRSILDMLSPGQVWARVLLEAALPKPKPG